MKRKKQYIRIILIALLSLCITACGKQMDTDCETELEHKIEGVVGAENGIEEDETKRESAAGEDEGENAIGEESIASADGQEAGGSEIDNVITAYLTENIEYIDEVMPAQYVDDLSFIADMKYTDSTYVYQDGKVYYRKYHEDSYEEAALWGMYDAIPGAKKEIVCIDSDGVETELFVDEGYGDIYLINNRFYMTEKKLREEDGSVYTITWLYSVDMKGNDRIDYGNGEILAIDRDRNIIVLEMWEQRGTCYYAMNYETGERKTILSDFDDDYIDISAYQDGWLYYERRTRDDTTVSRLCAVSLEGEQREILVITSDHNKTPYTSYRETILQIEVDKDRIYFIFGGYDGSAQVFQGGKLISVKLDGTDYKAIKTLADVFYLCHDNGKTLVYFPRYDSWGIGDSFGVANSGDEYDTLVWDVDANICYLSEIPENILYAYNRQMGLMWRYYPANKGALCERTLHEAELKEEKTDIYAVPDDSGKIVRVAMNLENSFTKWENKEISQIHYEDLYYADGFLYFTVEYNAYDEETSIGWRDGYRRLRSDVYRLKTGESTAQLLYTY